MFYFLSQDLIQDLPFLKQKCWYLSKFFDYHPPVAFSSESHFLQSKFVLRLNYISQRLMPESECQRPGGLRSHSLQDLHSPLFCTLSSLGAVFSCPTCHIASRSSSPFLSHPTCSQEILTEWFIRIYSSGTTLIHGSTICLLRDLGVDLSVFPCQMENIIIPISHSLYENQIRWCVLQSHYPAI